MERGRIEPGFKYKFACGSKEKKTRTAAKAGQGIGQNGSADVPKHAGWSGDTLCCLESPCRTSRTSSSSRTPSRSSPSHKAASTSYSPSTDPN